ncbi:TetR family transcriptional regulator [Herbihabitans rhizosphaerae]|uniref:TetR family transcriptional regulator n=1 Tax=Herbihabitans rhizosphaerae TaxID=1872711 RepID=A0A4Q7KJL3_9PSEU|nr:TetR/AcrR family transcriptional regulator [Herbihabitans rhizosphaerae]RZS34066.1 TetR family transcriptional regulator [Herbihabitans rhizosphaerae]
MRADAQRNRDRLLDVAKEVVEEHGTQASLRDIARRAEVGMGTLYRHFPTRDALLEALLGRRFDRLAERADALADSREPAEALRVWVGEFVAGGAPYRGINASMIATLQDPTSALHASCAAMRNAGTRLLQRAQQAGDVRNDVDGLDLFALINAVGWITEQAESIAERRAHLVSLVLDGLTH